jgi:hypothetical protein
MGRERRRRQQDEPTGDKATNDHPKMTAEEEGNEWEDSASSEWLMTVRSLRIFSTRLMIKTSPGAEERNMVDRNDSREW